MTLDLAYVQTINLSTAMSDWPRSYARGKIGSKRLRLARVSRWRVSKIALIKGFVTPAEIATVAREPNNEYGCYLLERIDDTESVG